MLTRSEEDHLKAVYTLIQEGERAFTTDVAARLSTKASSVTDMLKKLADKGLLKHVPYHGVKLTTRGERIALALVRKHRLWESFLVHHLGMGWDEVHEIAEQLEHVSSDALIEKLDAFLGHPAVDPHGEPIPGRDGRMKATRLRRLSEAPKGDGASVVAVYDRSPEFLRFLTGHRIGIGTRLKVLDRNTHDGSMSVSVAGRTVLLGRSSADNILIAP
jgi:DtxR family transcriptional regulator, Mn-dependent transcriptional regulator